MRLRITNNAMGVYEPFFLHFTVVSSATFFFINLVLNYLEKSDTLFIDTHLLSSQRHIVGLCCFGVMSVVRFAMASTIGVINATLISMFNVV